MKRHHFGMDSASMAGPLEERLHAAAQAGFSQIMLRAEDLSNHAQGYRAAVALIRSSALRVMGLQWIARDDGQGALSESHRLDLIKALLEVCVDVGAPRLLVPPLDTGEAPVSLSRVAADLHRLANLAVPTGVRVALTPIPWSRTIQDAAQAAALVGRVGHSNLGWVLDAPHFIASGQPLEVLNDIAPEKVFLVQLADANISELSQLASRLGERLRVFPGDGALRHPLAALVCRLDWLGYDADYCLSAFNEHYRMLPAHVVARFAERSAVWVNAQVHRRWRTRIHPAAQS